MKKIIICIFFVLIFFQSAYADTVLGMYSIFTGENIYSPTLILDASTYKIWYGGWQNVGQTDDRIYYRTSSDNTNWSSWQEVLKPGDINSNAAHVNDPTITKHYNSSSGQYQYTMFYTICMNPCNQSDNQIYSSVSSSGTNWSYHQPLLVGSLGRSDPSAIIDQQPDGTFWRVYYIERTENNGTPITVKMVNVNGNRTVIGAPINVFTYTGSGAISNPEVRYFNNKWQLFFDVNFGDIVDIYKSESTSNVSWPSSYEVMIHNSGNPYCGTITPGILPASGADYDLYFGLTYDSSSGGCDLAKQKSIERWRIRD